MVNTALLVCCTLLFVSGAAPLMLSKIPARSKPEAGEIPAVCDLIFYTLPFYTSGFE